MKENINIDKEFDKVVYLPDDFEKADRNSIKIEEEPAVPLWKNVVKAFCKNKISLAALLLFLFIILFAFVGPYFLRYSYSDAVIGNEYLFPSFSHPFGTDDLGRDMLARVMAGTRVSLLVGIFTTIMVFIIGAAFGAIAGYCGGMVDNIMMRILDVIYSIPTQLVVILFAVTVSVPINALFDRFPDTVFAKLGSGMVSIFLVFAFLYWPGMARVVRSSVLQNKNKDFIRSARTIGASGPYIIKNHLLPNGISVIIVCCTQQIRDAIFAEAFLSFIGMGVSSPMASLGSLVNDARTDMQTYPYLMLFPVLLLFLITLSLYFIGDGARDAFDPSMQK